MIFVDWNALIRHIDRSLPGKGLWMQCVPVFDDDAPTEEGVGLAIQRESSPGQPGDSLESSASPNDRYYLVVFFRVVPDASATGPGGGFLAGRGDQAEDWEVVVGYEGGHATLEEAVEEAKGLTRNLPKSAMYPTPEKLAAALDKVSDPEDLQQLAR